MVILKNICYYGKIDNILIDNLKKYHRKSADLISISSVKVENFYIKNKELNFDLLNNIVLKDNIRIEKKCIDKYYFQKISEKIYKADVIIYLNDLYLSKNIKEINTLEEYIKKFYIL